MYYYYILFSLVLYMIIKKKLLNLVSIFLFFSIIITLYFNDTGKIKEKFVSNQLLGGTILTLILQLKKFNEQINIIITDIETTYDVDILSNQSDEPIVTLYTCILETLAITNAIIESDILIGTSNMNANANANTNSNNMIMNLNILNDPEWNNMKYSITELEKYFKDLKIYIDTYLEIFPNPLPSNYDTRLKKIYKALTNLNVLINENNIYISSILKY